MQEFQFLFKGTEYGQYYMIYSAVESATAKVAPSEHHTHTLSI